MIQFTRATTILSIQARTSAGCAVKLFTRIENASTSDRYQLTLTTYERAKTHYGSMKGFNFQLKQPLDEKRFQMLWKRLNQDKGLQFLTSIEERTSQ